MCCVTPAGARVHVDTCTRTEACVRMRVQHAYVGMHVHASAHACMCTRAEGASQAHVCRALCLLHVRMYVCACVPPLLSRNCWRSGAPMAGAPSQIGEIPLSNGGDPPGAESSCRYEVLIQHAQGHVCFPRGNRRGEQWALVA